MINEKDNKLIKSILIIFNVIIVILLLAIGYKLLNNSKYKQIEQEYVNAAVFIVNKNLLDNIKKNDEIILTKYDMMKLITDHGLDNDCNGYVKIKAINKNIDYYAYINCSGKYTSKNFNELHLK